MMGARSGVEVVSRFEVEDLGPVVDCTSIYRTRIDADKSFDLYDEFPCVVSPWESAVLAYENDFGNVMAGLVIQDEYPDGVPDGQRWETVNALDWGWVRWVSKTFVFIGGESTTPPARRMVTQGPMLMFRQAVGPLGQPLDYSWAVTDPRIETEGAGDPIIGTVWQVPWLTFLQALNFLSCRNVTIRPPVRSRPEARRLARTGVELNEIVVVSAGRASTAAAASAPVEGGIPLTTVRGNFKSYGPDYGRGLLFGKYSGRFWHPAHARGIGVVARRHDYRLRP